VELNDPELDPIPAGELITDDAELQPIEAEIKHFGAPKGPAVQAFEAAAAGAAERGEDVKLIWVVLPVAAAGMYILTRKRGQPDQLQPTGAGTVPTTPGAIAGEPAPHAEIITASWTARDLAALVNRIVEEEGYNRPEVVHAIIAVESGWNPNAVNRADHAPVDQVDEGDSAGLMQLKVRTAQVFEPTAETVKSLLDPVVNVRAGVRFLATLERKWIGTEGIGGVIQMYNLGETRYRNGERNTGYLGRVQAKIQAYNLNGRT